MKLLIPDLKQAGRNGGFAPGRSSPPFQERFLRIPPKKMFLILLQYIRPLSAIDHFMEEHKVYLDKYYRKGNFIFSGRKFPRTGGLILCKAENRREVEQIISEDPFDKNSLAMYDIIEFQPTQCLAGMEQFLQ